MSVFDNNHNLTFSALFGVEVLQYNGSRSLSKRELEKVITNLFDEVIDEKDMMYFDRVTSQTSCPRDAAIMSRESAKPILEQLKKEGLFYSHTINRLEVKVGFGRFEIFISNMWFHDMELEFRVVRRYEHNECR